MTELAALIFDCDGTLVDSAPVYAEAWEEGFSLAVIAMDHAWYTANNGLSEEVLVTAFERRHEVRIDREAVVARMRAAFLNRLAGLRENTPVADIARGYSGRIPLAGASGGPRPLVEAALEATGLRPIFAHVVTVDDVPRPKPDPGIFLEAAGRLGVLPGNCLAFEDSPVGVCAARRAGMQVVDIPHGAVLRR